MNKNLINIPKTAKQVLLHKSTPIPSVDGKIQSAVGDDREVIGGRAYSFDRTLNSKIDGSTPVFNVVNDVIKMKCCLKYNNVTGVVQYISNYGGDQSGIGFFIRDTGVVGIVLRNQAAYDSTLTLTSGKIHYLEFEWDYQNGTSKVKVDGIEHVVNRTTSFSKSDVSGYSIGWNQTNTDDNFSGVIYSYEFSIDGVLVHKFNCEEGYGLTAFDSSGNGNHGTITLGTSTETAFHYKGYDVPYSDADTKGFNKDIYNKLVTESISIDANGHCAQIKDPVNAPKTGIVHHLIDPVPNNQGYSATVSLDTVVKQGTYRFGFRAKASQAGEFRTFPAGATNGTIKFYPSLTTSWAEYSAVVSMPDAGTINFYTPNHVETPEVWISDIYYERLDAVPAKDDDTDVLGNPLKHKGPAKLDAQLRESACFKGAGNAIVEYGSNITDFKVHNFEVEFLAEIDANATGFSFGNVLNATKTNGQSGFYIRRLDASTIRIGLYIPEVGGNLGNYTIEVSANNLTIGEVYKIRLKRVKGVTLELYINDELKHQEVENNDILYTYTSDAATKRPTVLNGLWVEGSPDYYAVIGYDKMFNFQFKELDASGNYVRTLINSPISESKGRFISNLTGSNHGTVIPNGAAENTWWGVQDKFHWNEVEGYGNKILGNDGLPDMYSPISNESFQIIDNPNLSFEYLAFNGTESGTVKSTYIHLKGNTDFHAIKPDVQYKFSFEIYDYVQGNIAVVFGSYYTGWKKNNGVHTVIITSTASAVNPNFRSNDNFVGKIKNFRIDELTVFPANGFNSFVHPNGEILSLTHIGAKYTNKLSPKAKLDYNPKSTPVLPVNNGVYDITHLQDDYQKGDGKNVITVGKNESSACGYFDGTHHVTASEVHAATNFIHQTGVFEIELFAGFDNLASTTVVDTLLQTSWGTPGIRIGNQNSRSTSNHKKIYVIINGVVAVWSNVEEDGKVHCYKFIGDGTYVTIYRNGVDITDYSTQVPITLNAAVSEQSLSFGQGASGQHTHYGKLFNAKIKNGNGDVIVKFLFQEGAGSVVNNLAGTGNGTIKSTATLNLNTFWSAKQSVFHWNKVWGNIAGNIPLTDTSYTANDLTKWAYSAENGTLYGAEAAGVNNEFSIRIPMSHSNYYMGAKYRITFEVLGVDYNTQDYVVLFLNETETIVRCNTPSGIGKHSVEWTVHKVAADNTFGIKFGWEWIQYDRFMDIKDIKIELVSEKPCLPKTFKDSNSNMATNLEEVSTTGREILRADRESNNNIY